jgi:hypothetical protein
MSEDQVDEQQRNQRLDKLFSVTFAGRPSLLYVVFEHASQPGRWVALRVLAYMVGTWKDLSRQRPRPRLLPPILPVIVSCGRRRWKATTDLASLIDLAGLPANVREHLLAAMPQFRFTPYDFASRTADEVRAMGLSPLGLWTIACQQFVAPVGDDDEAAIAAFAEWADVARRIIVGSTAQQVADTLFSYLLKTTRLGKRRLRVVFEQHIGTASMTKFESTYDRITRESEARGVAKGVAKGERLGRARLLQQLLQKRFGPLPRAVAARIARASIADLARWADRVLDAETLTAVFDRE